jgi:hypothetical protein
MSRVESEDGFSKVKGQAQDIFYGSPLALIGVFVEVIRARFRGLNNGTPWLWKDDPRPAPEETGDQGAPRSLYVESGLTDDPEARQFRPAIYVEKEETRYEKVVVGDRYGIRREDRFEAYYALTETPMTVQCVSTNKGESAVIGDHTWFHLMATKNLVRETFNIHELSNFTIGKTQPYRRSPDVDNSWSTPISFTCRVEMRWFTRPNAPLLQEIYLNLQRIGNGNPVEGALEMALYSTRRR